MEKELMILGIVRMQRLHGYRLWELLKEIPMGVRLRRSNAYRILDSLAERGYVRTTVEREGNRPERRVFEITPAGEAEFDRILRASLSDDAVVDLPNSVGLNYLDALPAGEAAKLLERRLASVRERVEENDGLSQAALDRHPGVAFAVAYDRFEADFLAGLIAKLKRRKS